MDAETQALVEDFSRRWTEALPVLSAYAHSLIPNGEQAEDLLQDVAVTALRRFAEYDRDRSFRRWVMGIVRVSALASRRQVATGSLVVSTEVAVALANTAFFLD